MRYVSRVICRRASALSAILALTSGLALSADLHVGPGQEYATIPAALTAAGSGDTIKVHPNPGQDYAGNISVSKAVTIVGWDNGDYADPEDVIIDGGHETLCMELLDTDIHVGCLTLTSGDATSGGALRVRDASAQIDHCILSYSTADYGGALYVEDATVSVSDCVISGNTASEGGGIYIKQNVDTENPPPVTITDCTISGNTASVWGGGIYYENGYYSSALEISGCTISGNDADGSLASGGGVYCNNYGDAEGCEVIATNCVLSQNTADLDGGGIGCSVCTIAVDRCRFTENTAGEYGGAAHFSSSEFGFTNNLVDANAAGYGAGAGIYGTGSTLTLAKAVRTLFRSLPS